MASDPAGESVKQVDGVESDLAVNDAANLQELSNLIQSVLQQTQDRFQTMSDQVVKRIDEMSGRIDDLERNINALMVEAGVQPENAIPNTSLPAEDKDK